MSWGSRQTFRWQRLREKKGVVILMSSVTTTKLSDDEVKRRLGLYKDSEVTNELYDFGKMMVDEAVDRFKTLDSKATAIAAYAIGLITILVSTQTVWTNTAHLWAIYATLASGIIAFAAAAFGVSALWLKRFAGFSQDEWMKADCLSDPERLRRYHILAMCGVHRSYQGLCKTKASRIAIAQGLLLASAIILVLALAKFVMPGTVVPFGIAIR